MRRSGPDPGRMMDGRGRVSAYTSAAALSPGRTRVRRARCNRRRGAVRWSMRGDALRDANPLFYRGLRGPMLSCSWQRRGPRVDTSSRVTAERVFADALCISRVTSARRYSIWEGAWRSWEWIDWFGRLVQVWWGSALPWWKLDKQDHFHRLFIFAIGLIVFLVRDVLKF